MNYNLILSLNHKLCIFLIYIKFIIISHSWYFIGYHWLVKALDFLYICGALQVVGLNYLQWTNRWYRSNPLLIILLIKFIWIGYFLLISFVVRSWIILSFFYIYFGYFRLSLWYSLNYLLNIFISLINFLFDISSFSAVFNLIYFSINWIRPFQTFNQR